MQNTVNINMVVLFIRFIENKEIAGDHFSVFTIVFIFWKHIWINAYIIKIFFKRVKKLARSTGVEP